ncbi:MAG: hypothetical protein J0J10_05820 [Bosea sp.]|uniref:hypothetical protein n=1 Tax=Bosea sp. (in: a-proteobacteria) TaxID=1871050 RepID=UPI001ACF96FD|nr:hypothetical protein [Bosea sp. (in: a-proteobacteria)]MBN9468271.1 hypothetical protein [Bosea sp. (in: a-proteobacteria)]
MANFAEQMQRIFERYNTEVDPSPVSLDEVAVWAIRQGLYRPEPRDITKLCREALAESLRQQKRTDAEGRKYRAKHSVKMNVGGTQMNLWADIDNAPRSFMEKSFSQRRKSIIDDCFQIKQDVDHYNEVHASERPIQMVLDFTDDIAEIEAAIHSSKRTDDAA